MTDQEWQDLGRRAVACKHWRWMPGMRAIDDHENSRTWLSWERAIDGVDGLVWHACHGGCIDSVPDLRDPATLGCLLALVREAWADAGASVWRDHRTGLWCWMAQGAFHSVHCPGVDGYDTEAESLVAALEAAP